MTKNSQNDSNETKNLSDEQQDNSKVDVSRRHFSRLGAATPILLTLASRPVFGGNCLSNMMSGNLSDPDRGQCGPGWSPGGWRNPVGEINGMDTLDAWSAAGYYYGELDGNNDSSCFKPNGTIKNKRECYSGGSVYADTPLPGSDSRTLIEILGTNDIKKHCITALLNASLSENTGGFNYVLTVDQVIGLCNGSIPVPGGLSLNNFLDSTWI
jgi:hypothetical protein